MSTRLQRALRSTAIAVICIGCGRFAALAAAPNDAPAGGAAPAAPAAAPMMGMSGMAPAKAAGAAHAEIAGDGKAEATLQMDVRKFDFAGTKAANRLYMPEGSAFSATKPEGV